jgi:hypothetical protein
VLRAYQVVLLEQQVLLGYKGLQVQQEHVVYKGLQVQQEHVVYKGLQVQQDLPENVGL